VTVARVRRERGKERATKEVDRRSPKVAARVQRVRPMSMMIFSTTITMIFTTILIVTAEVLEREKEKEAKVAIMEPEELIGEPITVLK
jgi:hypothetical protein